MDVGAEEFLTQVEAIIGRFFRQNDAVPPPASARRSLATRLAQLVAVRGVPTAALPESEHAAMVARVLAGAEDPLLAEAARQLVKTCFYPERRDCRDSFREVTVDGVCRRQQRDRVRGRMSGAHCVDCPHWVSLGADEHAAYLAAEWVGDVAEFRAHPDLFLPEDFRALRCWLHAARRESGGAAPPTP